jgi:hypothetical protein
MSKPDKEFEVVIQLPRKQERLPIIAKDAETAKAIAARLLRRRGKGTIVGATEKK